MDSTIDLNVFKDRRMLELVQLAARFSRSQRDALLSYAVSMLSSNDPGLIPEGETDLIGEFWNFCESHKSDLYHRSDMIAVNLPEVIDCMERETGKTLPRRDLIRMLPMSKRHPFRYVRTVHSVRLGKPVKCWIFFHDPESLNLFNWRDAYHAD